MNDKRVASCSSNTHSPDAMPHIAKIIVYPIKSLHGVELQEAELLPGGSIAHDREFALFDEQGNVVNAKRTDAIHRIRSKFDLSARTVTLWSQQRAQETFHMDGDRAALEQWFSDFFGFSVYLKQDLNMGFPDDVQASGPTIVSIATLAAVASWFPLSTIDEMRWRFRANLEIEDAPAFWEDSLFSASKELLLFEIGSVRFLGSHPCQRCVVPTRHPETGDRNREFQRIFSDRRHETLPEWAAANRFDHFYKLTLNTQVPPSEAGKRIFVGDRVVHL